MLCLWFLLNVQSRLCLWLSWFHLLIYCRYFVLLDWSAAILIKSFFTGNIMWNSFLSMLVICLPIVGLVSLVLPFVFFALDKRQTGCKTIFCFVWLVLGKYFFLFANWLLNKPLFNFVVTSITSSSLPSHTHYHYYLLTKRPSIIFYSNLYCGFN